MNTLTLQEYIIDNYWRKYDVACCHPYCCLWGCYEPIFEDIKKEGTTRSVVDIGCHTGAQSIMLRDTGVTYYGVDLGHPRNVDGDIIPFYTDSGVTSFYSTLGLCEGVMNIGDTFLSSFCVGCIVGKPYDGTARMIRDNFNKCYLANPSEGFIEEMCELYDNHATLIGYDMDSEWTVHKFTS